MIIFSKRFLVVMLFAAFVTVNAVPALATGWFWGSDGKKTTETGTVKNGILQSSGKQQSAYDEYRGHQTLTIVNPGDWGSPNEPARLTSAEDMNYLTMVMERQQKLVADIKLNGAKDAKEQAERNAMDAAVARQNIANSVDPLNPVEIAPSRTQIEKSPRTVPKVPVAEWEKINQKNQKTAPKQ